MWNKAADMWSNVWPWMLGLIVAMGLFFWLSDAVLGYHESHQGTVQGKLYHPPWVEPSWMSRNCGTHGNCTTTYHPPVYHPESFDVELVLDTTDDGTRTYSVSKPVYLRVNKGSVLLLGCRRGFFTRHLYCLP